jgi:putative transposase
MIRTFRYPLRPTKDQEVTLTVWLAQCCELYNAALEQRRDAWRKQRVSLTRYGQQKELTQLRGVDPQWAAVPAWVQRSALERLDRAFKSFFRRIRNGEPPGFPRFRSRDRYDSFGLPAGVYHVHGNRIALPKLGEVDFHKYRELRGELRDMRVHRGPRGWSVSFVCDLGDAPSKGAVRSAVGIDVGLEAFATLSTGERVKNPRFFRASEEMLARRQQALARKRRGSKSRCGAKRLVARAHERIHNQRLDFARKLAVALFARFDLVAYEDLQIARMVRGNLAKAIHDAAWGQFLRALQSKAEGAGKWSVPVDPRGTSQICAACGVVIKKGLSEREHRCDCGFVTHRDHNSALVIEGRGLRLGLLTEAPEGQNGLQEAESMTQGKKKEREGESKWQQHSSSPAAR